MSDNIVELVTKNKKALTGGTAVTVVAVIVWLMQAGIVVTPAQVKEEVGKVDTKVTANTEAIQDNTKAISDVASAQAAAAQALKSELEAIKNELKEQREDTRRILIALTGRGN